MRINGALRCAITLSFLAGAGCVGEVARDVGDEPTSHVDPPKPTSAYQPTASGALRKLTAAQYLDSLRDLLGPSAPLPSTVSPDVPLDGLVAIGAARLTLSTVETEQYEAVASDVAQRVVTDPAWRAANVPCAPSAVADDRCARAFVAAFGRRAWRRPLADEEVARWAGVATAAATTTNDFWKGLGWALSGLLQSPYFVYRGEVGAPDTSDPYVRRLDGYELATRLSYFLWNTTPDGELLTAAANGQLATAEGLRAQADRLLASPRSHAAIQTFFADRLRLDDLAEIAQPAGMFPQMTPTLFSSMRKETLALVEDLAFVREGDLRELIDGAATFVNDELATLYGLARPGKKDTLVRTTLPEGGPRAGYLGQGSFLALNSHPALTSPTRRGKFVREVLMCQPVAPPPPDVNVALPPDTSGARTMREKLELHRADPVCAGCHGVMDPIGLAFENFDAIGAYRATDGGRPIDSSGTFNGEAFAGAASFAHVLRGRPEVAGCFGRGLFRYLTGHLEGAAEEPVLASAQAAFAQSGFKLRALVKALVESPAFTLVASETP